MGGKRIRTSKAWEYFHPTSDFTSAKCKLCSSELKTIRGSTTGLTRHLSSMHNINLNEVSSNLSSVLKPNEAVSKLAALDGIPFRVIATSDVIRNMFESSTGSKLPVSPSSVKDMVLAYYEERKAAMTNEILNYKSPGKKLSITTDEWTSIANARYMNINLHAPGVFWNLGLVKINGSFTANECLDLLNEKLSEFNVDLENDIFSIVTDGAAVMKRFVSLSGRKHQLCLAHGIHLAVVDVLYKFPRYQPSQTFEQEVSSDEEDVESHEAPISNAPEEEIEYVDHLESLISKVRKTVKMFRQSPRKMEILDLYSLSKQRPIMDTRTRWNSLLSMLERFLVLKDSIKKALIDIGEPLTLSEEELEIIESLVKVLLPVKVAVEALCRRETTLITADTAIEFMMGKLREQTSELGTRFYEAMKVRISQRRSNLSEVANYLYYGGSNELPGHQYGYFSPLSRQSLVSNISQLYELRSPENDVVSFEDSEEDTFVSQSLLYEVSLESQLNAAINKAKRFKLDENVPPSSSRSSRDRNGNLLLGVKREMATLENSNRRGKLLESVLDSLLTIPPCSVESERVFSSANNFCQRIRSRLSHNSLNALVCLKSYLKSISK